MAINFEKSYTSTDDIVGILQECGLNVDNQENCRYYQSCMRGVIPNKQEY